MNLLKGIYCNQHYELKPKGKAAAARVNGTGLVTVALALNFFALLFLFFMISPDFADFLEDLRKDIFGRSRGRNVGRIVAIVPFGIIYLLVRFTMGQPKTYAKIIAQFERLSNDEQKLISNRALRYFLGSVIAFVLILILFFVI